MSIISDVRAYFRKLPHKEKISLQKQIIKDASPGLGFYLYVVLSGTIATLGLLTNSSPVIIGAMLLAPLMSPIIGIGLSTVIGDWLLLKDSFLSLLRGALLAVTLAAIIALINTELPFVSLQNLGTEIVSRTRPTPIDLVIAIAGGLGGAYALSRRDISAALPGVAIATALMPPLGVIGIGLASLQWNVALGAFLLFITNSAAIAFAAGVIFFLIGFGPQRNQFQPQKQSKRLPASMVVSSIMILLLVLPLTAFALTSFQTSSVEAAISETLINKINEYQEVQVDSVEVDRDNEGFQVLVTIQTPILLTDSQVNQLRAVIETQVENNVYLTVNQIVVTSTFSGGD